MMKKLDVYKCTLCGNIVEVLHAANGTLTCCGKAMDHLVENTTDAAQEKHVPVFEGWKVKVGSVAHPMQPEHFIEWVELIDGNWIARRFLNPGETPEVVFDACSDGSCSSEKAYAREYCNLHGLWKGEK